MSDAIVVAVLSLIGTLGGSWLGVRQASKLVNFRLESLESKVDGLAGLGERIAKVEAETAANTNRIEKLERGA